MYTFGEQFESHSKIKSKGFVFYSKGDTVSLILPVKLSTKFYLVI